MLVVRQHRPVVSVVGEGGPANGVTQMNARSVGETPMPEDHRPSRGDQLEWLDGAGDFTQGAR
jgi:hypothetical protein